MGADMLTATIAVPSHGDRPDFEAGRAALAAITDHASLKTPLIEELEFLLEDFDDEKDFDEETNDYTLEALQRAGRQVIDALEENLYSRETSMITAAGYDIYIAGGLSWGDTPNQTCEAIWNAYQLPEPVLLAMGFVPDYSKPLARKNGSRGPITDTDVIDAIELGLSTNAQWDSASDYLDWIAQVISRVRPDGAHLPPASYLAHWRKRYGFDPLTDNFLIQYVGHDADEITEDDERYLDADGNLLDDED